ncbi:MAG: hypothetical protein IPM56_01610 [Ignavibacteriales bacterium]|nr:MAG: hypothetical protein IPM56_01610 [Ignavibacteriales bacterium]
MKRLVLAAVLVLISSAGLVAQNPAKLNIKPAYLKNLELGIMSENNGLSRSSVYLCGKYKIAELVNVLTEKVKKEEDESLRLLIALTLNEISTPESMAVVDGMSVNDPDLRVKKFCKLIMNEYLDTQKLVDVDY